MNRSKCRFRRIVWAGLLAGSLAFEPNRGAAADCGPVITGNDPASWNSSRGTFLGRALGQTFYAFDTLITRITVWRPPNAFDPSGLRLFVTTVDSVNYSPFRPTTQSIIQNGPTVVVPNSDLPGQLIRMDFNLDPPLALPHLGTYAFFFQREGCDAGETLLIATEPGSYPYGTFWVTGRTASLPCFLRDVDIWEDLDLCFEIEFCRDTSTPVREESWGRLKLIYR